MFRIGNKLRDVMLERKLTIRDVASLAGLNNRTVGKVLKNGLANAKTVGLIAAGLGISGAELLNDE